MRGHTVDDFARTCKLWGDERVIRFIGQPQTREECWSRLLRYAGHWALLGFGYWVVEEKQTGEFVGEVGFANYERTMTALVGDAPELGWVLSPEKSGRGYATEAALGALAWGQAAWGSTRTVCIINPEHTESIRVASKCGFEAAGLTEYKGKPILIFEHCPGLRQERSPELTR